MQPTELKNLSRQADTASRQREEKINALNDLAMKTLENTMRSGFEDKESLVTCCSALDQMIRFDSQDYRPYFFTGYLLLLMNELDEAEGYLNQARLLNPELAEAARLLQILESERQKPVLRSWNPDLPADQAIDFALLEQEITLLVQQRFKQMMELPRPTTPGFDNAQAHQLRKGLSQVSEFLQYIEQPLSLLSGEIEEQAVARILEPLLAQQRQLEAGCSDYEKQARLRRDLRQTHQEVLDKLKLLRKRLNVGEASALAQDLNRLYDTCDAYADQLDALSEQGHPISQLEKTYERLLQSVGQMSEELQAQQSRLGITV